MASNNPDNPIEKTVKTTIKMCFGDVNIDHKPSGPRACPKIEPKSWNVDENDAMASMCVFVTPIGIPITVVIKTESKNAPGTLATTNKTKMIKPINPNKTAGGAKVEIDGVVPPFAVMLSITLAPPPSVNGLPFNVMMFCGSTKKFKKPAFFKPI